VSEPESNKLHWSSIPNLLSLSRVPLGVVVFVCICYELWTACFGFFFTAAVTDWLDGWWARRYNHHSVIGRSLDPLTDKFLICGTFIYLQSANVGILPWMVVVVVGREILITGLRGIVEATGRKFGADWFGKLKTVLQCIVILGVFLLQILGPEAPPLLRTVYLILLYTMLAATIGSGIQYSIKAMRILNEVE
jgi:CDP-diacylglycerol---glycerol-3-phosphate 3-phosphatidyltransferase